MAAIFLDQGREKRVQKLNLRLWELVDSRQTGKAMTNGSRPLNQLLIVNPY
ncbi:Putative transcription activator [Synechocystis sp. PCC 6803]|nr:Putative transcription activator [Synechocystis sp. PCC 6803] [Bacillus subtilis BEST7613]